MKTFKARVWDEKRKHMHYIDDLYFFEEEGVHEIVNGVAKGHHATYLLTEFTGTYDDNNNELYSGDVCYFTPMMVETVPTFKGVIEWDKYRFAIRNLDYDTKAPFSIYATPYVNLDLFALSVRKIGNKFENPELLDKK